MMRRGGRLGGSTVKRATPYLLITPAVVIVALVLVYPLFANIVLSFFDWQFGRFETLDFVGWENFQRLFTRDPFFWRSLRFTLSFTLVTITFELVLGLAVALLLNQVKRGKAVITAIALLPFMAASLSVGIVWALIFSDPSPINYILEALGLSPVYWLASSTPAFWSVVIAEVWRSMPFVMLILLAALSAVPRELIEAARADGAGSWQTFSRVITPLLRPAITVVVVFLLVFKLRLFDLVVALTGGGPASSTMPIGLLLQQEYFVYQNTGEAAAIGVVLLILGIFATAASFKLVYRRVEY